MSEDRDELLARIAQLPEAERHRLMVELARRYGLPDVSVVGGPQARSREGLLGPVPDYRIVFRGGTRGSAGQGYGGYVLSAAAGGPMPLVHLDLGERVAGVEAQYDTLIAALQDLLARLGAAGRSTENFTVEVCTDSEMVVSQLQGSWQTRDPRMQKRCSVSRQLLERFRGYRVVLWDGEEILRVLGQ